MIYKGNKREGRSTKASQSKQERGPNVHKVKTKTKHNQRNDGKKDATTDEPSFLMPIQIIHLGTIHLQVCCLVAPAKYETLNKPSFLTQNKCTLKSLIELGNKTTWNHKSADQFFQDETTNKTSFQQNTHGHNLRTQGTGGAGTRDKNQT